MGNDILMLYQTIGHHGTTKVNGSEILSSKFEVSRRDNLWLGDGVYFFDDNAEMALEWCRAEGHRLCYTEYSVLQSEIEVKEANLFNLNTPEGEKLFHGHRELMIERLETARFSVKSINKQTADGRVLNELCQFFPYKVVTLRCFVRRVKDRMKRLNSNVPNCKIICVREVECIKSTKLYKEGDLSVG